MWSEEKKRRFRALWREYLESNQKGEISFLCKEAVYAREKFLLDELISKDADYLRSQCGFTELMLAIMRGKTDLALSLINQGSISVGIQDHLDRTALMLAAMGGYVDVVKKLISVKACVNQTDKYGKTALIYAAMGGHADVVKQLLDAGADKNLRDIYGFSALDYCRYQISKQTGDHQGEGQEERRKLKLR